MKLLDLTLSDPQENLDLDETLLKDCNAQGSEVLRFWESVSYFVVLGRSKKAVDEAFVTRCQTDKIPILRRCSGGGTVLQGPGCLNFALVKRIEKDSPFASIKSTNETILTTHQQLFRDLLPGTEFKGITDLAIKGIKFSGNAQRRLKNAMLFHGSFLYDFDLSLIEKYLRIPAQQPEYRQNRPHSQTAIIVSKGFFRGFKPMSP